MTVFLTDTEGQAGLCFIAGVLAVGVLAAVAPDRLLSLARSKTARMIITAAYGAFLFYGPGSIQLHVDVVFAALPLLITLWIAQGAR